MSFLKVSTEPATTWNRLIAMVFLFPKDLAQLLHSIMESQVKRCLELSSLPISVRNLEVHLDNQNAWIQVIVVGQLLQP